MVKQGWKEYPVIWALVVAPSGALKTPALKAAMEGLEEAQKKACQAYAKQLERHKEEIARCRQEERQGKEPEPPILASYYLGDTTLEAVGMILDQNPRGILIKRDELSGWLGGFDKYSQGNEAAQYLEFHSASAVRIDRKGGDKKTIYIPRALVSVTGTIQAGILQKLLAVEGGKHMENGMAARFLMAMPPERKREWRETSTPPELVQKYVSLFDDLLSLRPLIDAESGQRSPVVLQLSPAAKARYVEFYDKHSAEMLAFKSNHLKSAWSKLESQVLRLALIFQCVRETYLPSPDGDGGFISLSTLEDALAWIEWLKGEARRIYYALNHSEESKQADKLLAYVKKYGGRCTARDAARDGAGGRKSAEVEALMESLVKADLGEWEKPANPKGGRPTKVFCLKGNTGNASPQETCRETDETPAQE